MEVKSNYQQTEVGRIPLNWGVVTIQALVDAKILAKPIDGNHGEIHPKSSDYVEYGIPFIMANNFVSGQIDTIKCKFITKGRAEKLQKGFSVVGDVLLTHKGTIGCTAIVDKIDAEYIVLTPQVTYYRVLDLEKISRGYLRHYFDSQPFQTLFKSLAGGGTRAYLGIVKQLELPIIIPPFVEQCAISKALGDIDALLIKLDQLIAKKRDLKQATMQQLLTGQTRLPSFHLDWKKKTLGELAEIISGGTPKTSESSYWGGEIKWCTPTDITGCDTKYLASTERTITDIGLARCGARLLPVGALLLCSRATIGEIKIASCEVATNQGFKAIICNAETNNEYLYYKLLTMKREMIERAFGSTFLEISKSNIATLEILLPDYDEQLAIATLLSEMDDELEGLEKRRTKTLALKQAMMQELLTGKTRLISKEENHA